jgi:hypothetical protein
VKARGAKASVQDSTLCVLCEFALSKIDEELKDDATEVRKFIQIFQMWCFLAPTPISVMVKVEMCCDMLHGHIKLVILLPRVL